MSNFGGKKCTKFAQTPFEELTALPWPPGCI